MLKDTTWSRSIIGATAGVTLALAVAVAAGATPSQDHRPVASGVTAATHDATVALGQDAGADVPPEPGAPDAVTATEAPSTPEAASTSTADATGSADAPAPGPAAPAPVAPPSAPPAPSESAVSTPPPAPTAPAAPVTTTAAPRQQPSAAAVQQALDGLDAYVDSVFTPTAAQVHEAGDKVCTAFDEGQTFVQVKATARELVARVPLTTVHAGADDYVVRTVVGLYCPAHASKLV